jgi:hypothetical protein
VHFDHLTDRGDPDPAHHPLLQFATKPFAALLQHGIADDLVKALGFEQQSVHVEGDAKDWRMIGWRRGQWKRFCVRVSECGGRDVRHGSSGAVTPVSPPL